MENSDNENQYTNVPREYTCNSSQNEAKDIDENAGHHNTMVSSETIAENARLDAFSVISDDDKSSSQPVNKKNLSDHESSAGVENLNEEFEKLKEGYDLAGGRDDTLVNGKQQQMLDGNNSSSPPISNSLENKDNLSDDQSSTGVEMLNEGFSIAGGNYATPDNVKSGVNLYESVDEFEIRKRKGNNENSSEEVSHVKDVETNNCGKIFKNTKEFSLFNYLKAEVTQGYLFEEQGEKYIEQREKMYTFMKTPRELEKLLWFGFLLCLDCFLFVFTYLPVRLLLALLRLLGDVVWLRFLKNRHSLLEPYHICDLLRGLILIVCCTALDKVDLSILYHIVRGQSVIKLYVIYNMLDIADRLFSSIGQDSLDALFWTAAERKERQSIVMVLLHLGLASIYIYLHAVLVLFIVITLNVAINSHNKVLMVVMISNQFVELKGCVFKKYEKNNLFQISCADIRERFFYVVLVSLVALRNMQELQWNLDHLYELMPSIGLLLCSEIFVDWIKHAFITKFNGIPSEVYLEYRELLAHDVTSSRLHEQRSGADHFDLVSRRLGFIPLPLGCLVYRVTSQSVKISGVAGTCVLVLTFIWLMSLKVLNSIILLGMSCGYVTERDKKAKTHEDSENTPSSPSHDQPFISDPLDKDPKKQVKPMARRKAKTLSEIDRYTLCSNRIV